MKPPEVSGSVPEAVELPDTICSVVVQLSFWKTKAVPLPVIVDVTFPPITCCGFEKSHICVLVCIIFDLYLPRFSGFARL